LEGGDDIYKSEIHVIKKNHRLYDYCDDMCFKAKNLYNYANYIKRQSFKNKEKIQSAFDLNKELKTHEPYMKLPSKTSQQVILGLDDNWKSFFVGIKEYNKDSSKFCGRPKPPKYKDKNGRFVCRFDYMQIKFNEGRAYFQGRKEDKLKLEDKQFIETNVNPSEFKLLQIIPYGNCYKISLIYKTDDIEPKQDNGNYLAIDLGLNNFATCVNNKGAQPFVINGKVLKSENQYYNKLLAKAMSYVGKKSSNRIKRTTLKRNNIIHTHLHRISRFIIRYCEAEEINTIVIGRNKDWKRDINLGKKVNQKFVQIPHEKFIDMIIYKSQEVGIAVKVIDERYTSKSSFIDNDILPSKFGTYEFSGKRVKRGLYKSKDGILINADVNGAYNILRKSNPEFKYHDGIQGVSLHPIILNI
jgi:putative transposase